MTKQQQADRALSLNAKIAMIEAAIPVIEESRREAELLAPVSSKAGRDAEALGRSLRFLRSELRETYIERDGIPLFDDEAREIARYR